VSVVSRGDNSEIESVDTNCCDSVVCGGVDGPQKLKFRLLESIS